MESPLLVAFLTFTVATSFTPGPNNIMLMSSGVNFGFRRTLPHVFGVAIGFAAMVMLIGIGLGSVFRAYPWVYTGLKYAGAAFQWINAKGWVMAVGAVTTYAGIADYPANIVVVGTTFLTVGLVSSATWLVFGTALRHVLESPRALRAFNVSMGLLLAASLVPVLWEG